MYKVVTKHILLFFCFHLICTLQLTHTRDTHIHLYIIYLCIYENPEFTMFKNIIKLVVAMEKKTLYLMTQLFHWEMREIYD